jgi:hypothetical protein
MGGWIVITKDKLSKIDFFSGYLRYTNRLRTVLNFELVKLINPNTE